MARTLAAVDAYVAKAQPFARPILEHFRALVHATCPDVEEKVKWGMPFFDYRGSLCHMAAFKAHAAIGFWKHGQLLATPAGKAARMNRDAMGAFGRLASVRDLPPKRTLQALIRAAMKLNELGSPSPAAGRRPRPPIPQPAWFTAALKRNAKARATWTAFAPGHRREYLEWLTEAKTDATRERRLATALEWLADGRKRNWRSERPRAKATSSRPSAARGTRRPR